MPGKCAAVKHRRKAGLAVLELDAQQAREEVMEAVPLATIVERQEEQVRAGERVQQLVGTLLFEHRVTQRAAQPFENRGAKHERLHRGVVCFEHLVDEEVDHVAALGPEPGHEAGPILDCLKREGREVEPGGPALGALDEIVDGLRFEPEIETIVQEHCRPRRG